MKYLMLFFLLSIPVIVAYAQDAEEYVIGELSWTQLCFRITNVTTSATVQVTDLDMNKFPSSTDTVKAFVYSDSHPEGITLILYETDFDSGIFERTFGLSDQRSAPSVLHVQEGDTITAKYVDTTLPPPYTLSDNLELTETAFIGCSSPPLERVPASAARMTDSVGNTIYSVTVGKQAHIISDIANGQDREQKFAWIAQIVDERNKIVSLGWINGVLNPESAFSPSVSWIPKQEGKYIATMFVWESLDNPTALSPPISIDLEVMPENPKIPRIEDDDSEFKYPRLGEGIINRFSHPPLKQFKSGIPITEIQCREGLELIFKSNDSSPVCVNPETKQKLTQRGWAEVVLSSTGSTARTERQDIPVTYGGPTDIPSANNQFAIKFYSQISQENTDNVFFSPASIFTAFAIAYEGAEGNTATEMEHVFGFEPDDSARHKGFTNMQQRLNFEGQNNTLSIANALWLAKNFEPYEVYVSNVENYYSGKVESVDFASKEKSLDIINQWVLDNTGGKIEKIFETLNPNTKLAITNAIYFKGMWEEPFEKDRTAMTPFHVGDGLTVSVPMMELKTTYLNQAKTPTARILELPYEGSKISMLILLPNEIDGIRALEDSLSAENIASWQDDYTKIKTKAYMPKFKLETDYDLIPPLIDLGMRDAFGNADFTGISALDLSIYKAVHKAIVEVNEEGTEAAAATGMAMLESGPVEFRADRPFVFVIQDNETGQILFMGRVTDPTK